MRRLREKRDDKVERALHSACTRKCIAADADIAESDEAKRAALRAQCDTQRKVLVQACAIRHGAGAARRGVP
jgi:hypothetical protein